MKPFAAVQALLKTNQNESELIGTCFRVNAPSYYITASHCINGLDPQEIEVMNCLDKSENLACTSVYNHPKADIVILKVEGNIPEEFETFQIVERDNFVGVQVHCFGMLLQSEYIKGDSPARVVGGIIQRDFLYKNNYYEFLAFELSNPIPKGMSGGPAFIANKPNLVVGIAIGAIKSEIVVSEFTEYEGDRTKEREKRSEITRYGVVLRLNPIKDWIDEIINK